MTFASDQSTAALLRAVSHSRVPQTESPPKRAVPTGTTLVAISESAGAGAAAVAGDLSQLVGWKVYDRELLEQIARQLQVPVHTLADVDQRHVSWIEESLGTFSHGPHVSEKMYLEFLTALLLSLVSRGEAIVVGRAASHILPRESTLRVRLVAPMAERAARLAAEQGTSAASAARRAAALDEQHGDFIRTHFHVNPHDMEQYDVVLNTGRLSIHECAQVIRAALEIRRAFAGR
jgi:cytidylate kinase